MSRSLKLTWPFSSRWIFHSDARIASPACSREMPLSSALDGSDHCATEGPQPLRGSPCHTPAPARRSRWAHAGIPKWIPTVELIATLQGACATRPVSVASQAVDIRPNGTCRPATRTIERPPRQPSASVSTIMPYAQAVCLRLGWPATSVPRASVPAPEPERTELSPVDGHPHPYVEGLEGVAQVHWLWVLVMIVLAAIPIAVVVLAVTVPRRRGSGRPGSGTEWWTPPHQ